MVEDGFSPKDAAKATCMCVCGIDFFFFFFLPDPYDRARSSLYHVMVGGGMP